MKKCILLLWMALCSISPVRAQAVMRDVFKTMPDSLLMLLSSNDRMDLLDFNENHMAAEVSNRLDGKTKLDTLTNDYLHLTISSISVLEMKLVTLKSGQQGVLVAKSVSGPAWDTTSKLYKADWSEPLALADYVTIPSSNQYFTKADDDMSDDERLLARQLDPFLVRVNLSPDSNNLTFTRSVEMLPKSDWDKASALLQKIVVEFISR